MWYSLVKDDFSIYLSTLSLVTCLEVIKLDQQSYCGYILSMHLRRCIMLQVKNTPSVPK